MDGSAASRRVGVPRSASPEARKRVADPRASVNTDPEMTKLAAGSGLELIAVGSATGRTSRWA